MREPFVVLALHGTGNGMRRVEAIPIDDEMQAHEAAESLLRIGCRSFFIRFEDDHGGLSIEEYEVDDYARRRENGTERTL